LKVLFFIIDLDFDLVIFVLTHKQLTILYSNNKTGGDRLAEAVNVSLITYRGSRDGRMIFVMVLFFMRSLAFLRMTVLSYIFYFSRSTLYSRLE